MKLWRNANKLNFNGLLFERTDDRTGFPSFVTVDIWIYNLDKVNMIIYNIIHVI